MEEEYEIQHYGFSIAQLKQETRDMIQYDIESSCNEFVKSITTSPLVDDEIASEIERKKNILAKDIGNLFKESMQKIDNIISENFEIPMNVTLSTDQLQLKHLDENEEQLQKVYDTELQKFMQLEQFMATLNDELKSYSDNEHIFDAQRRALDAAELSLSSHSNFTYLVDLAADMSAKLKKKE